MAFRLGKHTVCGEIFNTTPYSVHGWIELRGRDHPLVLQLTGNCSPDLAGWHFRFEAQPPADPLLTDDVPGDLDTLALQQIGPTGTMTAARRVWGTEYLPGFSPTSEKPEVSPPRKDLQCLYLEWFSQNGRVVIELVDPILEFVEYHSAEAERQTDTAAPEVSLPPPTNSDGDFTAEEDLFGAAFQDNEDDDECKDDPFELFPRDLQHQLDLEARETDWNLQDDEDKPPMLREMELMDDLIENSPGVPLSELFEGPLQCPLPDQLEDHQVEEALKTLLAQLALFGVALDICQHFTPREAYRLLLQQICPEERAYPELRNTQWVQHYSTSDYCEQCQAELEREFDDREHRANHDPSNADVPDDPDDEIEF